MIRKAQDYYVPRSPAIRPRQTESMQKNGFIARLLCILTLLCLTHMAAASGDIRIASWNTKHLGWDNGKNMAAVAEIVSRFDLVALQEVMRAEAAEKLADRVSQLTGESWDVITSDTVGRSSYQEGYAFLWRRSAVVQDGGAVLYLDPGDKFAREPYSAVFHAAADPEMRFVLATVHITYGDSRADRTPEIRTLAEYWDWLAETFDAPVILAGDFNTPPDDAAWKQLRQDARPMIRTGATTLSKTDGQFANLYDNLWLIPSQFGVTSRGIGNFPEWLGIDHKTARDSVSDHAPVFLTLRNIRADTDGDSHSPSRPSTRNKSGHSSTRPDPAARSQNCIDINTAGAEELEQLRQIGPVRAEKIIHERPWKRVDALQKIDGLGPSRVDAIAAEACPIN